MTDHITRFIDHMRTHGIGPADASQILDDDAIHRYQVEGDKPRSLNGVYRLAGQDDGFAFGWCMSHKEGVTHSWHTKATRKASEEEREAWRLKVEASKADQARKREEAEQSAAVKAARIWKSAAREGVTEYLTRKQCGLHGARISRDDVVVPVWRDGKLIGLQFIKPDGVKLFLKGQAMDGGYFPIASAEEDKSRLVICEGFATGAALRQALALPVIVAFNAANLIPVAKAIRRKYPEAKIDIAADNDQFTKKPNGEAWNPGIEKARAAAGAIGGARVIYPNVPEDDADRRTDWDDIARTDGPDVIRQAFAEIQREDAKPAAKIEDPLDPVRPLGHDNGIFYFFPRAAGQIIGLSATALGRIQSLYSLAPAEFWESYYGGGSDAPSARKICESASAHLIAACHQRGIFRPEQTRGVGAWMEEGQPVINCGDWIVTPTERVRPAEYEAKHVYESGPAVYRIGKPLTNHEAVRLRDICRKLKWKNPLYGDLLAGWLVVAAVGSALNWRPHIWITGKSGAGKSTVLNEIIKPALGTMAIGREGGTTESGVRKAIGSSGRPYVLDEFESETAQQRMETSKILFLARRASSGGIVENNNGVSMVRNCFCFSAINPAVEQVADKGRITFLELDVDDQPGGKERFAALLSEIHEVITPEFSERLLGRTVTGLPSLIRNSHTFTIAAADHFGKRRAGDQIGPMLAGAYSLTTNREVTPDEAKQWIASHKWDWHTQASEDTDAGKLMDIIMTRRIRYDVMGMTREKTIADMLETCQGEFDQDTSKACEKGLRAYGIRIIDGMLVIANSSPNLRELLKDTAYVPWDRALKDWPGADNNDNKPVHFSAGFSSKVTRLPLASVLGGEVRDAADIEEPF